MLLMLGDLKTEMFQRSLISEAVTSTEARPDELFSFPFNSEKKKREKFLFSRITFRLAPPLIPAVQHLSPHPPPPELTINRASERSAETSLMDRLRFYMSVIDGDCLVSLLRALITLFPFRVSLCWESKDQRAGSF